MPYLSTSNDRLHVTTHPDNEGVTITITHPNGGVSEVSVYLFEGSELQVTVGPSQMNPFTITCDDVDLDSTHDLYHK